MPKCSVCDREFERKFSFQAAVVGGITKMFCSQRCRMQAEAGARGQATCATCGKPFQVVYAYQTMNDGDAVRHYCSLECRAPAVDAARRDQKGTRRIAVLNQKGGTGKTTTTVNLAAGLAEQGNKVLLVDVDSQGNVGVSLGVKPPRGLYHLLTGDGLAPEHCIVEARENLDLLGGGPGLETVESALAQRDRAHPERLLRDRLADAGPYDYVIIDCGPSRSLLNLNALFFAGQVVIPVGCDYLSLIGVRQIMQTLRQVNEQLSHPIEVLGVVPTFYDVRNRISHQVVRTLRRYFRDKVMPPIRVNTKLKEAPAHNHTIFEHDGRSRGAEDYRRLVRCIVEERWESPFDDNTEGAPLAELA